MSTPACAATKALHQGRPGCQFGVKAMRRNIDARFNYLSGHNNAIDVAFTRAAIQKFSAPIEALGRAETAVD